MHVAVPRYSLSTSFGSFLLAVLVVVAGLAAAPVRAQDVRLEAALAEAGLDERLGETVPKSLVFYDEAGQPVEIGRYLDGRTPVLLTMVYHNCPMLCNLMLDAFTKSLKEMEWVPGQKFEIVTVSFAADETPELAARQKAKYLEQLGKPEAAEGWHFLTGDEASINALAQAIGFRFNWVEEQQTYAHPAVLTFLSGEGKITRYLYGLEYQPRHIRTALVEASEGRIGTPLDQALLFCFQFDPSVNSYVLHATNLMKAGGMFTLVVLGFLLFVFWRRENRRLQELSA